MDHRTQLEIRQVRSLILPLASALDCLHKNGILHRDLKPENILIGPDFTPKVTDFGIAVEYASVGSLTKMDQWLGTIGYVAPEQPYRLKVDERSDQYSMAAVIYEALTGQKPLGGFQAPVPLEQADRHTRRRSADAGPCRRIATTASRRS